MRINIRVYKANKGNAKAEWLGSNKKHKVIDEIYDVDNGNEAYKIFWEQHPEVKSNWEVRMNVITR